MSHLTVMHRWWSRRQIFGGPGAPRDLCDLAQWHPGVARRTDHMDLAEILHPAPLVAPQAESDWDQPVLLVQVGGRVPLMPA